MSDRWEPVLREWLQNRLLTGRCPIRTIELIEAVGGDPASSVAATRVMRIMQTMGWVRRRLGGVRGWWPGGAV